MREIGSRLRRIGAFVATVALVAWGAASTACGPTNPKTPDGSGSEAGFDGAGGGTKMAADDIEPADHDIEVPPAP